MTNAIEKSEGLKDLEAICQKYKLSCIHAPVTVLSEAAGQLYKKHSDALYAVCESETKAELVRYENEAELMGYCRKKGFDLVALVSRDGKGRMLEVEQE